MFNLVFWVSLSCGLLILVALLIVLPALFDRYKPPPPSR